MRVSGNTSWLQKQDWQDFCEYEEQINHSSPALRMTIRCTYPVAVLATAEPVLAEAVPRRDPLLGKRSRRRHGRRWPTNT
jgi:hypothetical protein